jgi:hypothetical protein
LFTCLSLPLINPSSLVTPTSHPTVSLSTCLSDERQVDKETVGCDVGVTKEDDLVGGSERQVDKETVGCDVGVTKEDDLVGRGRLIKR